MRMGEWIVNCMGGRFSIRSSAKKIRPLFAIRFKISLVHEILMNNISRIFNHCLSVLPLGPLWRILTPFRVVISYLFNVNR
jgi:hypothetical protein